MNQPEVVRHLKHRELEKRYQLLVQAVEGIRDYAIFMMDPSGNILTWNAGARLIKGYFPEEIIGRNFSVFYTPEDLDRNHPQDELEIAEREGRYEEEGWRIRKDGSRFWASVLISKITNAEGKILGFSKVTRDLTERRKVEEALRASEERFRQLVESVKDYAIFLLDAKGYVSTWNEGAQRLKGYSRDEVVGKHFSMFYLKEDIDSGKCDYELREAGLTGRFEDEGWRVRKDGTRFWANVVITALRDSSGRVTGFSKVTRDLTERKRAEDKLKRANEDLERRVAMRVKELSKAKADLEDAIQTRDQFLSIASHELKTPITSLKLQAQMLKLRVDSRSGIAPSTEKLVAAADAILKQSDRLVSLVDDLLDVARVKAGKFTYNFQWVDLSKLIHDSIQNWLEPLRSANCALELDIEPGIEADVDGYRLEQVLSNPLSNVTKYACDKPVWVSLSKEDRNAVLIVRDAGSGIPLERQEKIFERFERATPHESISGLGLGLYISKAIVEAHGGKITVESQPGEGSVFTVRIPLKKEEPRSQR